MVSFSVKKGALSAMGNSLHISCASQFWREGSEARVAGFSGSGETPCAETLSMKKGAPAKSVSAGGRSTKQGSAGQKVLHASVFCFSASAKCKTENCGRAFTAAAGFLC